ncbi:hexose transporter [Clavulina sp. PMI_390]|nr:hexose transporter [Clavulina sp. PMI_390]
MAPNTGVLSESALGAEHLLWQGKWWQNKGIRNLNLMLFLPLVSSFANGFDGSMMNGLQSLSSWRAFFNNPAGGRLGLFNAIQNIGSICGIPFAPYSADYLGRKPTIIFGAFVVCIGVALQTASQNFSMFIGARWLIGFGTSFTQLASPLLVTETAYPSQRAALSSLYNSMWFSGAIVAAWSTFGTFHITNNWSWRIPSLLQGLVSVIQIFTLWFIPESPRFLVRKGEDEKALQILAKYHANGDRDDPLIEFEYNEIKEAIRMEEEAKQATSFAQLFNTIGNLRRMRIVIAIAFFSQWSGNGLISYYFNLILNGIGITSTFDQTLINGILQIWNFAIAITSSLVTERFGRRPMFIVSTAGMTLFYMFITVCGGVYQNSLTFNPDGTVANDPKTGKVMAGNTGAAHTYIAMVFLFNAFYAIAYTPLLVSYTVEILPYKIRAKGLAVMNLSVTAALVFNQYTNPIAWAHLNYKYYIVYTVWNFFETIYIYLFAVETKGRTLEETALLFDNPEIATNLAARANVHGGHLAQAEALEKDKPSHSSQDNISDEK